MQRHYPFEATFVRGACRHVATPEQASTFAAEACLPHFVPLCTAPSAPSVLQMRRRRSIKTMTTCQIASRRHQIVAGTSQITKMMSSPSAVHMHPWLRHVLLQCPVCVVLVFSTAASTPSAPSMSTAVPGSLNLHRRPSHVLHIVGSTSRPAAIRTMLLHSRMSSRGLRAFGRHPASIHHRCSAAYLPIPPMVASASRGA